MLGIEHSFPVVSYYGFIHWAISVGVALSAVGAGYGGIQYDSLTHKLRVAISGWM